MKLADILPSILNGSLATVQLTDAESKEVTVLYVKSIDGVISSSESIDGEYITCTELAEQANNVTWALEPFITIYDANISFGTLTAAWDSIVVPNSDVVGSSRSSTVFRQFARAIGFGT